MVKCSDKNVVTIKKVPLKVKEKFYSIVLRLTMTYGSPRALNKKKELKMEVKEMRILK